MIRKIVALSISPTAAIFLPRSRGFFFSFPSAMNPNIADNMAKMKAAPKASNPTDKASAAMANTTDTDADSGLAVSVVFDFEGMSACWCRYFS